MTFSIIIIYYKFANFQNLNINSQRSMKLTSVSKSKSQSKGLSRIPTQKNLKKEQNRQESVGKIIVTQRYQKIKQNMIEKGNIKKLKGHISLSQSLKTIQLEHNQAQRKKPLLQSLNQASINNINNLQRLQNNNQHSYFSQISINNHKYVISSHKSHDPSLKTDQICQNKSKKNNMFQIYTQVNSISASLNEPSNINCQSGLKSQTILNLNNQACSTNKKQNLQNVMASSVCQLMNKKIFKSSHKKTQHILNFDQTQKQSKQNINKALFQKKKVQQEVKSVDNLQTLSKYFTQTRLCQTRIISDKSNSFSIQNSQLATIQQGRLQSKLQQKKENMHIIKNKSKMLINNLKQNISLNYNSPQINESSYKQNDVSSSTKQQKQQSKSHIMKSKSNISLNKVNSSQNKQNKHNADNDKSQKHRFKDLLNHNKSKLNQIKEINKKQSTLTLNDFLIGKKIGSGRFGNVYVAQHLQTQSLFALKVLDIKQIKDQQMQQQIISQIKLQSYLNHPNILKLYGFFMEDNKLYLILELADICLYKMLKQNKNFQQNRVSYYGKQMLESMKYFHSENIIHRDIKPENILVNFQVLKLGDFGWSVYSPIYKRQTFCGTLDYVSPEIIKRQFYDEKVDIWSFGVLLYELYHGYAPFETSNQIQSQTFQRILQGDIKFCDKVSPELKRLIQTILHKNPENRINLYDINESAWMQKHQQEGRQIDLKIWYSWKNLE